MELTGLTSLEQFRLTFELAVTARSAVNIVFSFLGGGTAWLLSGALSASQEKQFTPDLPILQRRITVPANYTFFGAVERQRAWVSVHKKRVNIHTGNIGSLPSDQGRCILLEPSFSNSQLFLGQSTIPLSVIRPTL